MWLRGLFPRTGLALPGHVVQDRAAKRPLLWRTRGALLALLLVGPVAHAARTQTLEGIFRQGNAAFFQGDFDTAIRRYQTLIEAGVQDPDVYFNLGTAHGRRGDLGYAVLYFSRANRLSPGDEEVARCLTDTREALAQRAAQRTGEATVRIRPPIREALVSNLSEDAIAISLLLFDVLFFGALLFRRFAHGESRRLAAVVIACLGAVLFGLAGAALAVKLGAGQPGEPVVVVTRRVLREGPDPKAQSRGEVDEGSLAHALATEGRWVRVRVIDGEDGWLPREAVGRINPD